LEKNFFFYATIFAPSVFAMENAFLEHVVGILQRNNGEILASSCCNELYTLNLKYKPFVKAQGGFKKLCSRHSEKLEFVHAKCGQQALRITRPQRLKKTQEDTLHYTSIEFDFCQTSRGSKPHCAEDWGGRSGVGGGGRLLIDRADCDQFPRIGSSMLKGPERWRWP
jgi:hypothetical protein